MGRKEILLEIVRGGRWGKGGWGWGGEWELGVDCGGWGGQGEGW